LRIACHHSRHRAPTIIDHPGKPAGAIQLSIRARLDARPERWVARVQGIGSGYWRVVGQLGDLIDAAEKLRQRWVKGIGFAKAIESVG